MSEATPRESAYWLMVPAVVFTLLMIAFPVGYTTWLSLNQFKFGSDAVFNGGTNFLMLAQDALFWKGLARSLGLYVICLVAQLALGLYLGILLNQHVRGHRLLRTILISPFMIPAVVVSMMWLVILDPSLGAANYLLEQAGLPKSDWLASPQWVLPTIALIDTWQWSPFIALIVLGGLQSLPQSPYEAAAIDGASDWQTFVHITLPLLLPTLLTAAILRSVDLLRFFDIIYITTQGGPGDASTTLNILAYKKGFEFFDIGYASAIMLVLLALVLAIVGLLSAARRHVQ